MCYILEGEVEDKQDDKLKTATLAIGFIGFYLISLLIMIYYLCYHFILHLESVSEIVIGVVVWGGFFVLTSLGSTQNRVKRFVLFNLLLIVFFILFGLFIIGIINVLILPIKNINVLAELDFLVTAVPLALGIYGCFLITAIWAMVEVWQTKDERVWRSSKPIKNSLQNYINKIEQNDETGNKQDVLGQEVVQEEVSSKKNNNQQTNNEE